MIYDRTIPIFNHSLAAFAKILAKAEAHCEARKVDPAVLLASRLYPDMLPFTRQVQIACDGPRRAVARLMAQEPASVADSETTFAELRARIDSTLAVLAGVTPKALAGSEDRTINLKAGQRELTFTGTSFVNHFALPNFFFHLSIGYAILRHNGVEIGKADFLGG